MSLQHSSQAMQDLPLPGFAEDDFYFPHGKSTARGNLWRIYSSYFFRGSLSKSKMNILTFCGTQQFSGYDYGTCLLWWGTGRRFCLDPEELRRNRRCARWYAAGKEAPEFDTWTRDASTWYSWITFRKGGKLVILHLFFMIWSFYIHQFSIIFLGPSFSPLYLGCREQPLDHSKYSEWLVIIKDYLLPN